MSDILNTVKKVDPTDYPFDTEYEVISFYLWKNPARALSINLLEPERGNSSHRDYADGLWAACCKAINRTISEQSTERALVFTHRYLSPRETQKSGEEIAKIVGVHEDTVYRWCGDMLADLRDTCRRMGILPPPEPSR